MFRIGYDGVTPGAWGGEEPVPRGEMVCTAQFTRALPHPNTWIPAFVGMTEGGAVQPGLTRLCKVRAEGRSPPASYIIPPVPKRDTGGLAWG